MSEPLMPIYSRMHIRNPPAMPSHIVGDRICGGLGVVLYQHEERTALLAALWNMQGSKGPPHHSPNRPSSRTQRRGAGRRQR